MKETLTLVFGPVFKSIWWFLKSFYMPIFTILYACGMVLLMIKYPSMRDPGFATMVGLLTGFAGFASQLQIGMAIEDIKMKKRMNKKW